MQKILILITLLTGGIIASAYSTKNKIRKNMTLTSNSFTNGEPIPQKHASKPEGDNVSPQLSWSNSPEGTKGFVLICDDPDAPSKKPWVHWVLFNISPDTTNILENVMPSGAVYGKNSWNKHEYDGPLPPAGKPHRYFFKIYAVSEPISIDESTIMTRSDFEKQMHSKILGSSELIGTYQRY